MSSPATQKPRYRPNRTLPAVITALVLVLVGAGLVWSGIAALAGDTGVAEGVLSASCSVTWGSTVLYAASAASAIIGVVLLLAAVLPGRRTFLTAGTTWDTADGTDGTTTIIARTAVERFAAARAEQVDGVSAADCSLRGSRLEISLTTYLISTAHLQRTVRDAVQSAVDDLGLKPAPRISTVARTDRDD